MRMIHLSEQEAETAFAKKAAEAFRDPRFVTYTEDGTLTPGEYLAIRWGLGKDCVVVVKLDEYHKPVNYQNLVEP